MLIGCGFRFFFFLFQQFHIIKAVSNSVLTLEKSREYCCWTVGSWATEDKINDPF